MCKFPGNFPTGRSYTLCELRLVQKSQNVQRCTASWSDKSVSEASFRFWKAMIGNRLYPIMLYIQAGVACGGLSLFKVHVYIEILLLVCFSESHRG